MLEARLPTVPEILDEGAAAEALSGPARARADGDRFAADPPKNLTDPGSPPSRLHVRLRPSGSGDWAGVREAGRIEPMRSCPNQVGGHVPAALSNPCRRV